MSYGHYLNSIIDILLLEYGFVSMRADNLGSHWQTFLGAIGSQKHFLQTTVDLCLQTWVPNLGPNGSRLE